METERLIMGRDKRNRLKFMLALHLSIIAMWVLCPPGFETNDDPMMMSFIAGYRTGTPEILPRVMSAPYSFLISRLYLFIPVVPWYMLAFLFLLFISAITIGYAAFSVSEDIKGVISFSLIMLCIYSRVMLNVQFTTVAAMCGAGAWASAFCIKKGKNRYIFGILFIVLIFFSYTIRRRVGVVSLAIALSFFVKEYIITTQKKFLVVPILTVLMVIICSTVNKYYVNSNSGWQQYAALNSQRSQWKDYPHIQYSDNESLYKKVGWDKTLYSLAEKYCELDENQTAVAYKELNEAKVPEKKDIFENITSAVETVFANKIQLFIFSLLLAWAVYILIGIHRSGVKELNSFLDLIFVFAILLLYMALLLYFSYIGRIPPRIIWFVTVVTITPVYLTLLNLDSMNSKQTGFTLSFTQVLAFVVVFLLVQNSLFFLHEHCRKWDLNDDGGGTVYQYVLEHDDNWFIFDSPTCMFANPFIAYKTPVTNAFFWGGWLWGSPLQIKMVESVGLEQCYFDTMLEEGKYFIVSDENAQLLLDYYEARYDDIHCDVIYRNDIFTVYSYRRKNS